MAAGFYTSNPVTLLKIVQLFILSRLKITGFYILFCIIHVYAFRSCFAVMFVILIALQAGWSIPCRDRSMRSSAGSEMSRVTVFFKT